MNFVPIYVEENHGPRVLAIVIVFPFLAAITVALRVYTRVMIIKNPSSEDLCINVAMAIEVRWINIHAEVHYGLGRHVQAVSLKQTEGWLKSRYASIIIYNFGLLFTKLSILLQYLRICVSVPVRHAVYGVIAFVIAYSISSFFASIFTCTPVAYFWNPTIPGGRCVDKWALYFANGGMSIVTDFAILVLPAILLKDLLLPMRQKVTLVAILALGGAACIASIVRLQVLCVLSKSQDPTWDSQGASTWSIIELNIGIICASVSTLRPLFSWPLLKTPVPCNRRTTPTHLRRISTRKPRGEGFNELEEGSFGPGR
ncbi:hypothetical protein BKA64DRAFT_585274 [Cadophora sp. MPI-SDFR-AT-0126]|nr:hypothetical protein BKA64DRAFT_585274 [Leotiomycetes sp. MPI-SDFR-AT-0126]